MNAGTSAPSGAPGERSSVFAVPSEHAKSSAAAPLRPATLPLRGSQLIEASAGTGKTWTIAALYVRLVLGHGGTQAAYLRPLQPSEILVMTFTVAATRELSDRIRTRLIEAARAFRAADGVAIDDALLAELIADYRSRAEREHAAWRLEMAAQAMDDAAVHTIDAWCQRMLRDHAFDSGCLFDEELSPDDTAMIDEAARDYWRLHVYPLQGAALDEVLTVWKDAAQLVEEARRLVWQPWPRTAGGNQPRGVGREPAGAARCRACGTEGRLGGARTGHGRLDRGATGQRIQSLRRPPPGQQEFPPLAGCARAVGCRSAARTGPT